MKYLLKLTIALTFTASAALAGDLEWSGVYRIEGYDFQNLSLKSGTKKSKSYGVHQLILHPKIVAADGLYINSQINLARTTDAAGNPIGGNQMGAIFGHGLEAGGNPPNSGNAGTLSESQEDEGIVLSQFYLTHVQEFGSLIVGRAPVHFGLGMTHNAGRGPFDHYMDTRDLIGYKIVMGNFYFLPMRAKVKEDGLAGYDDINEWLIHLQYENPENDTEMGLMYWDRRAHLSGNDSATGTGDDIFGQNPTGDYAYKLTSIYFARTIENIRVGFEVGNQSGDTHVDGRTVKFSGMGIAAEFEHRPQDKKWHWGFKAGWATGDDKTTPNEYEGFVFDRNYDVALMMFNQVLGQANFLHTEINGTSAASVNSQPDVEAISNVMYLSPYWNYKWNDKWSLGTSLTMGWLDQTKLTAINNDGDNSLGYELDLSLNFSPNERVVWQNTFGWLVPGSAFEGDNTQNFSTADGFGFMSRAAISF